MSEHHRDSWMRPIQYHNTCMIAGARGKKRAVPDCIDPVGVWTGRSWYCRRADRRERTRRPGRAVVAHLMSRARCHHRRSWTATWVTPAAGYAAPEPGHLRPRPTPRLDKHVQASSLPSWQLQRQSLQHPAVTTAGPEPPAHLPVCGFSNSARGDVVLPVGAHGCCTPPTTPTPDGWSPHSAAVLEQLTLAGDSFSTLLVGLCKQPGAGVPGCGTR